MFKIAILLMSIDTVNTLWQALQADDLNRNPLSKKYQ